MKLLLAVATFVAICIHNAHSVFTETQMKSTAKLLRNTCQPRNKVTNEQIDNMHKGIWDGDRKAMCYMACILKMLKVADDAGDFLRDSIETQLATLPEPRRKPTEESLHQCDAKKIKGADACETAYLNAKCFYESNPSNYFLP